MSIQVTSGSRVRLGAALAAVLVFAAGYLVGRGTAPTGAHKAGMPVGTSTPVTQAWWEQVPAPADAVAAAAHVTPGPSSNAATAGVVADVGPVTPDRFHELSQAARRDSAVAWRLLQQMKDSQDVGVRQTLVNVLNDAQRPLLGAQIQQWMGSVSARERALAFELAQSMGEVSPAVHAATRKAILQEADPQVLASALGVFRPSEMALGPAEMDAMALHLRQLTRHQDAQVRQQSLGKLIEVDPSPAVEADLAAALKDPDVSVRVMAIDGLVRAGVRSEAVASELMRLSLDPLTDGPVRVSAMEALAQFRLSPAQRQQLLALRTEGVQAGVR